MRPWRCRAGDPSPAPLHGPGNRWFRPCDRRRQLPVAARRTCGIGRPESSRVDGAGPQSLPGGRHREPPGPHPHGTHERRLRFPADESAPSRSTGRSLPDRRSPCWTGAHCPGEGPRWRDLFGQASEMTPFAEYLSLCIDPVRTKHSIDPRSTKNAPRERCADERQSHEPSQLGRAVQDQGR